MSTTTGPLNPEPSQPQERIDQNLDPKSYASALTEPLQDQQIQIQNRKNANQNSLSSAITSQGVPTSPSLTWTTSGTKTPTNDETELYEKHVDGNGHVLTSLKRDDSYDESLRHDEAIAPRRKSGDRSPKKENTAKQDERDEPKGTAQLKTGRRAGAGWERSAYVFPSSQVEGVVLTSGVIQNSMGTAQCARPTTPTNSRCLLAQYIDRSWSVNILLPCGYSSGLAYSYTISYLYLDIQ